MTAAFDKPDVLDVLRRLTGLPRFKNEALASKMTEDQQTRLVGAYPETARAVLRQIRDEIADGRSVETTESLPPLDLDGTEHI